MNYLYEGVDNNKLYFEYVGPSKDVYFYEYHDSKQKNLLEKRNEVKIGRKTPEQEKVINNLDNFYNPREEVFNFFRDYTTRGNHWNWT